MRNVARHRKPTSLARNSDKWKVEFLEALAQGDTKLIGTRRRRYNTKDVREVLSLMYGNFCCYCEGQVGHVGADQIEHRRPVERFPELAFEWDNLHLACAGCNRVKSNKWNDAYPILDAVTDIPIQTHLGYETSETGVRQIFHTPRGRITKDHADLNRETLRFARGWVFMGVFRVITEARRRLRADPADPVAINKLEELREKCAGEFGSLIEWTIEECEVPPVPQ